MPFRASNRLPAHEWVKTLHPMGAVGSGGRGRGAPSDCQPKVRAMLGSTIGTTLHVTSNQCDAGACAPIRSDLR